jgi:hypothetical protein
VFRSVRDLEVHKCTRSSDATFFQSWSHYEYIENMASRSPKTWCRTHFHVFVGTPPSLGLDCYTHTSNFVLKMSKTGKIIKNPLYIRYNSKNPLYLKVKNRFYIDWECSGQFATFGNNNACLLPVIHAIYYA